MFNPLSLIKKPTTVQKASGFVALDIGTSSTKAYSYTFSPELKLMGQGTAPSGDLGTAIEKAVGTEVGSVPIVAMLGGSDVWCLTTVVRHNRPNPDLPIDSAEVENLFERALIAAETEATRQMNEFFGNPGWELQRIDAKLLLHRVDNVPVTGPEGRTGNTLEASVFGAYVATPFLNSLTNEVRKLNYQLWAVTSLLSLATDALASEDPSAFDAIILDIGGEITDVAVVFGGGVWGSRPIYIGGEAFTEAVAEEFQITREAAEEKKRLYSEGQLTPEEADRVKVALRPAVELFLIGVEAALSHIEGVKAFPEIFILTGGGAKLPDLLTALMAHPFGKTLPFPSPPRAILKDVTSERVISLAKDLYKENYEAGA